MSKDTSFKTGPLPQPYDANGYRYTSKVFPPYRHLPGLTPHPQRHPKGHQYGKVEVPPEPFNPSSWRHSSDYLYGADLYNFVYYWEAHEAWEGIWKTTKRVDIPGIYLQGLIQISAALLKREQGIRRGMKSLARAGLGKLREVVFLHPFYCGLDLEDYVERMEMVFKEKNLSAWPVDPRIRLIGGS
ncbi:DUF309 domain-containing protein [Acidobacteria bacterium AH-259-O06]|nr:DUF309 domain-containing protein [Acidobacteria bacterium AH-259-O06]